MCGCLIATYRLRAFASSLFLLLLVGLNTPARAATDIPADAPQDAIMAGPAEIQEMQDWASVAFTGRRPRSASRRCASSSAARTTASLRFGQSCIDTPIKIGQRNFTHGLGTHANSEIVLHLPPDAKEFKAFAGIDNNSDTGGVRGSAQFSVEIAGKEVFRTPTLRGTNAPVPVNIALPAGTRELTLKVDATADGPAHDQADWADACIVTGEWQGLLGPTKIARRSCAAGDALLVPLRWRCPRPASSRTGTAPSRPRTPQPAPSMT